MISHKYSEEEKHSFHIRRGSRSATSSLLCCVRVAAVIAAHTLHTPRSVSLLPFSTKHTHTTCKLTLFIQTLVPPADVPNITAHVEPKELWVIMALK